MTSDERPADREETEGVDDGQQDEGDAQIPQAMVDLLLATADLDPPVELSAGPDGTEYEISGRVFAWAAGRAFEVQLGPDIASAALRTPDVTDSVRGDGWIRLEPAIIDDHAADRVVAWFELARRIAVGRQARPGGGRRH